MSTITKEWLQQAINDYESVRDEIPFGLDDYQGNILAALRIALASLEAEAVPDDRFQHLSELYHAQEKRLFKLAQRIKGPSFDKYAHSPSQAIDVLEAAIFGEYSDHGSAAMLQGADGTLTNEVTIPANTPCKDAPEHIWLQTAGVWPENGEFSELTWCSDNQHPDDTLYVRADVVSDNSPVIPDCSCGTCRPVTFTDGRFVVCSECGNKRCPHANDHRHACTGSNEPGQEGSAYPAAPQQEV